MGRRKITDGTKIMYIQLPITEREYKTIGKAFIEQDFKRMIVRTMHNIEKGKIPNQINLIDSIAEIEQQKQPSK